MGRLIDAGELKEIIGCGNAVKYGNADREQQAVSYGTMMMYEINDAIDAAPTACEWHCVADEKPEEIESVLHKDEYDPILLYAEKSHAFYVGWYVGRNWEGVDKFINRTSLDSWQSITKKITHWMPLPKPPERSRK